MHRTGPEARSARVCSNLNSCCSQQHAALQDRSSLLLPMRPSCSASDSWPCASDVKHRVLAVPQLAPMRQEAALQLPHSPYHGRHISLQQSLHMWPALKPAMHLLLDRLHCHCVSDRAPAVCCCAKGPTSLAWALVCTRSFWPVDRDKVAGVWAHAIAARMLGALRLVLAWGPETLHSEV